MATRIVADPRFQAIESRLDTISQALQNITVEMRAVREEQNKSNVAIARLETSGGDDRGSRHLLWSILGPVIAGGIMSFFMAIAMWVITTHYGSNQNQDQQHNSRESQSQDDSGQRR